VSPNPDIGKLRNMLLLVIGIGTFLGLAKLILSANLNISPPKETKLMAPSPTPKLPKQTYRPIIEPKSIFTPKLTRSIYNYMPLVDMNDRGDYLFLKSPSGADYREFVHIYQGKSVDSERLKGSTRWALTKSGNILKRIDQLVPPQGSRMSNGYVGWAYNDIRFFRRFTDDGSSIYINSYLRHKRLTSRLVKEKIGVKTKVFYTSAYPLSLLEIDDKDSMWIKETLDPKTSNNDQLVRISESKSEKVALPTGYHSVERVVVGGNVVAATFGNIVGDQPIRSFVKSGATSWRELPIPPKHMFSYVQKILNNGLILGFVTDENRENMHQVVWKGDSVAILNDHPSWPKMGLFSFVTRATKRGDIYVRNVLNTESGSSENYLLNVGL
jgi:hypothetical protein